MTLHIPPNTGLPGSSGATDQGASDLVRVAGLRVSVRKASGEDVEIVKGVDFALGRGDMLALVGGPGSGKTSIALSLLGYARRGCRILGGSVRIGDTQVLALGNDGLQRLRGRTVAYLAQDAAAAFNPSRRIMDQVIEGALIHQAMSRAAAEAKAVALFEALALPYPARIGICYPQQVPAAHLLRLTAAMALIADPVLVVLDEPAGAPGATGLDIDIRMDALRAVKRVLRERGTTAVWATRDLALAAQVADRIVMLNAGEVCESGPTAQVLQAPNDDHTRCLLAAITPEVRFDHAEIAPALPRPLLEIRGLMAGYGPRDSRGRPAVKVLEDIDLVIRRGMALGVVGESGSGKTTLARVVAGMVAPTPGSVLRFDGEPLPPTLDTRHPEHGRRIQTVFQNADTALNPAHSVESVIGRPLGFYLGLRGEARRKRVLHWLDVVRLPAAVLDRRSSELSSADKQRVSLARALAAEPDLILCDEITSSLDTVAGGAILALLGELRRDLGVAYLFISHDMATMRTVCDEIMVLYAGRTVEIASPEAMLAAPFHPYSHVLMSCAPALRQGWLDSVPEQGALPAVGQLSGADLLCPFVRRCPVRIDGPCNKVAPPRRRLAGKDILCHRETAELLTWQSGSAPAPTA